MTKYRYTLYAIFIWVNDDPVEGNVLKLSNITEPRLDFSKYTEGQKVKAKCPNFGIVDAVLGKIADTSDRNTLTFCDACGQGVERGVVHRCPDIQQIEEEETVKEDVTGTLSSNNIIWSKNNTVFLISEYKKNKDKIEKGRIGKKDPIVKPLLTLSSTDQYKTTSGTSSTENTLSDEEDKSSPKPPEKDKSSSNPPSKKRRGAPSDIVDTFKEYISETRGRQEEAIERQERMHQERMKAYRGVEDALRSFLTAKKN
ncbi:unnamed protein product [Mytilus edulis]|uniref:Uncharacterized protein n=1 Tax=Mytilus edulis TaxID=6550 RepID=A0A8S3RJD6_MYTED|nr:unnamed protein product [Mytilus edulis]